MWGHNWAHPLSGVTPNCSQPLSMATTTLIPHVGPQPGSSPQWGDPKPSPAPQWEPQLGPSPHMGPQPGTSPQGADPSQALFLQLPGVHHHRAPPGREPPKPGTGSTPRPQGRCAPSTPGWQPPGLGDMGTGSPPGRVPCFPAMRVRWKVPTVPSDKVFSRCIPAELCQPRTLLLAFLHQEGDNEPKSPSHRRPSDAWYQNHKHFRASPASQLSLTYFSVFLFPHLMFQDISIETGSWFLSSPVSNNYKPH